MHPDAESDLRSPWYEAFTPPTPLNLALVRWIASVSDDVVESTLRPEPAEREWATEALFDCYNA